MTDSTPPSGPPSSRAQQAVDELVLLWGEMASAWGINRTMAQIHALLYASGEPLDTDDIMDRLQISRGNANMNLRALLDWRLVRKTHQSGSRKDFFVAESDVWQITSTIIEERQRREIQPVRRALAALAADLRAPSARTPDERALGLKIDALVGLIEVFDGVSSALLPLLDSGSAEKVQRVVQFASRLRSGARPSRADTAPDTPGARP